jgi:transcriptional regulator with XRE-family HTH domain
MPATAPPVGQAELEHLQLLGGKLRAARKRQRVTAVAAAEAAGISRVTLHRIERGEPSVAAGAWMAAAATLGLWLDIVDPRAAARKAKLPKRIRLADYPQLKKLAWQLHGIDEVTPRQALNLYERNWRHVDERSLTEAEMSLIEALSNELGGGQLLV